MIDTLQISDDLQKSGLSSKTAKELAHQFKIIREDILIQEKGKDNFATTGDIGDVKSEINYVKSDINNIKSDINDVRLEINNVRLEVEKLRAETSKSSKNQVIWLSGMMMTGFITLASLIISQGAIVN